MLTRHYIHNLPHRSAGIRFLAPRLGRRVSCARSLVEPRPSIDPLANKPRAVKAAPGSVYTVYTPEEVDALLNEHKDRLVVIMCKASHCKPCKTFMSTYQRMAELLPDSLLLDVTGDSSAETKKLMVQWGVKSTPTFRMYRGGECVAVVTGAKEAKVLPALTDCLRDGERGKQLQPEDLEDAGSDDEM
ncbi:thioredoxin [Volvox carteri f. nagariensis]|uniref:Thioredoxin n=1 Tax=Volvox carteri f. nagariensis TaxID=3068 RepID=D8TN48_VOLCA|nr:thioredoxin [Volvox carteri f. nagariensis]EFJ51077.1 thioredoxin [Volvox carteri f. nagariensis]|eukprot:XP_002948089.1 thioredoxin [Volvox carteri f. nagariensis]